MPTSLFAFFIDGPLVVPNLLCLFFFHGLELIQNFYNMFLKKHACLLIIWQIHINNFLVYVFLGMIPSGPCSNPRAVTFFFVASLINKCSPSLEKKKKRCTILEQASRLNRKIAKAFILLLENVRKWRKNTHTDTVSPKQHYMSAMT